MEQIHLFSSATGLNTTVDESRLSINLKTGESELAKAVNVTLDRTGRPSRRVGYRSITDGAFHSLFCDNGPCFVVQERVSDAAIMQVASDLSLSGVRSGLSKGDRVAFWQDGPRTYYTNGTENGVIVDGISSPWPDQSEHVGPETSRVFFPAPVGNHITVAHGRMWIFEKCVLWYSEPFAYGKFDKARGFMQFHAKGRMVRGVRGGLWVADSQSITFLEGTNPAEMMPHRRASYPILEWSDSTITVDAAEYGYEWSPGQSIVAVSSEGICLLGPSGEFDNIGKRKLLMPPWANSGATLIRGDNAIHTIWC